LKDLLRGKLTFYIALLLLIKDRTYL